MGMRADEVEVGFGNAQVVVPEDYGCKQSSNYHEDGTTSFS
jgi:hypothetical protein